MSWIYLDNSIIQTMIHKPEAHDLLYDWSVKEFGLEWTIVKSYYLFFEYIGFHKDKLDLNPELLLPDFELDKITPKNRTGFEKKGDQLFINICNEVYPKLISNEKLINSCISAQRAKCPHNFNNNCLTDPVCDGILKKKREIEQVCFGEIITQFNEDFMGFVQMAGIRLAWDIYCGISPLKIPTIELRKKQFDDWIENYKHDEFLPFSKIIGDFPSFGKNKNTTFYAYKDMVDAELFTYAFLGMREPSGERKPVIALTYDDKKQVLERKTKILQCIREIEKERNETLEKVAGKIYCLDRETHQPIDIIDISLSILP